MEKSRDPVVPAAPPTHTLSNSQLLIFNLQYYNGLSNVHCHSRGYTLMEIRGETGELV